jgi:hypothetical protein
MLNKKKQKKNIKNKILIIKKKKKVPFKEKLTYLFSLKKKILKKKLKHLLPIYKVHIKILIKKLKKKLLKKKSKKKLKKKSKKKSKKKKLNINLKIFVLNQSFLYFLKRKKKYNQEQLKILHQLFFLSITIRSNNVFVTLTGYKKKQNQYINLNFWSSGRLQLNCTKRKLKFIIYTMIKEIKKKVKFLQFFAIKISSAHFLHKYLYKTLKKFWYKTKYIIFTSLKIFNGCRSKKKRRKKHLKFRILR